MNRERHLIRLGVVTILACVSVLGYADPTQTMQIPNPANPDGEPIAVTVPVIPPSSFYPQLSLKNQSVKDALDIYLARLRQDPSFEGKVALSFYGKVVDENNLPVAGASARLMWNTVAVPGGTAFERVLSDANGLFSLSGQCGKFLGVRVKKDGYYTVDGGAGQLGFEYAEPSSSNWYEPDPNKPVIFHLKQIGEGAKLFSKHLQIPLSTNHPLERVNLMLGFLKPDGVLTMTCDTSHSLPGAQPYPWTFGLSMAEGGLVETSEQFPFLAPANGYVPSVNISDDNLDRSVWQGGVKKTYYFYLPSTNTYGRFTVEKVASLSVASLDFVYNLKPGNRVLESASK